MRPQSETSRPPTEMCACRPKSTRASLRGSAGIEKVRSGSPGHAPAGGGRSGSAAKAAAGRKSAAPARAAKAVLPPGHGVAEAERERAGRAVDRDGQERLQPTDNRLLRIHLQNAREAQARRRALDPQGRGE